MIDILRRFAAVLLLVGLSMPVLAADSPSEDVKGAKDSPIISRFRGAVIIGYQEQDYAALIKPLGPYDEGKSSKFANSQTVEGRVTSIAYAAPEGKSALEVYRNYEQTLADAGFKSSFKCEAESCGGYNFAATIADPVNQAMAGDLFNLRINLLDATNGDVRALTARLDRPNGPVDVVLLVSQDSGRQPGVLLQIVEGRPMDNDQVNIDANAMSNGLATMGHIALYGIQFDTESATLKPQSNETLAQMAKMLADHPSRKVYVVGHTDSTGSLKHNIDLSGARAASVVNILITKYRITPDRLSPKGLGPFAPVASNADNGGRAKNRRVELVEQ